MRTYVILLALLALAAVPGGSQAEDSTPADEEARLQELERILAESEAESEPEPDSDTESEPEPEPDSDTESEPDTESDPDTESEPKSEPRSECASPVLFRRGGVKEPVVVRLVDCAGQPASDAVAALGALAQPPKDGGGELQQLNPGLLVRLQRIAERFPGHAIELVSGLRPKARPGSRHRSGDALDLRVEGASEAELAELVRTFEGTGVGFYPNSKFVHIDVRTEPAYWVDRSRPGEPPDYGPWPPAAETAEPPVLATVPVEAPAEAPNADGDGEPLMKTAAPPAAIDPAEPLAETDSAERPVDAERPLAADDAQPVEPADDGANVDDGDPELQALLDRALSVMNSELAADEDDEPTASEPEAAAELL